MRNEQRKCCGGCLPGMWWWLLAPLGLGLLYLGMLTTKQKPIEADVSQRSMQVLSQNGFSWATAKADEQGRDITLSGIAPDEAARQQAIEKVKAVHGVRVVNDAGIKLKDGALAAGSGNNAGKAAVAAGTLGVGTASGLLAPSTSTASSNTTTATATLTPPEPKPAPVVAPTPEPTPATAAAPLPATTATATVPTPTPASPILVESKKADPQAADAKPATDPLATTPSTEPEFAADPSAPPSTGSAANATKPATGEINPQAGVDIAKPAEPTATMPETKPADSAAKPAETPTTVAAITPETKPTPPAEPPVVLDNKQQECQDRLQQTMANKTIQFNTARASISSQSNELLNSLATVAKDCGSALGSRQIEIGGHTDSDGDDGYNQALSNQRAEAIKQFLVTKGVAATMLTVKGYGESQPVAPNETKEGRAQNRRIEFKLK